MKKLLTILSAFGLVASASINVVACGDTKPPEIKEKTDWVKEDAIKNLGELHYEKNGDEIKIVSDTFEFEAFDSPSNPEEVEWKKEIKLKNEDVKKLDTKLYGNSTIENQWNYEIMSYISLSKYGSEEDAIKDYNESLKYTNNPYLNFSEDWFRGDAHHYRIYRIEHQLYDKNGDNAITVYFTTIMFDFIFGYINENIDKVMQEIIIDFEELCKDNKREDVHLVKDQNKYILQGIKLSDVLMTAEGEERDVYFILFLWFEWKCYILSKEINEFNIKKSEFDYLKKTSYEVPSGLDKKETKLQLAFSKKSPIYLSNFNTWLDDPEQDKHPLFINLEEA
ncbi:lipoprotein [Spiroplasma endosymbiont of Cantharis rufa]|uniref:lipoprotein n=1 Tax=Spiroplasma endosymbiont of Cantharis rufa TaxID=3066279 RepID=UPI0030D6257C